jgi:hypothetical protein
MTQKLLFIFGALLLTASFGIKTYSADFTSIEGTYVLQSRELADGTILTPPSVAGLYVLRDGYMSLNRAAKDSKGNITSRSAIGTYKIKGSTYSMELIYNAGNDGTGISYDFDKKSGSSEMVITDGNVEMNIPLTDNLYGSFGPDSFTSMSRGKYIDKWVKVK